MELHEIQISRPKKDSYWRAICAAARKLLVIIWFMLKRNQEWKWKIQGKTELSKLQTKLQRKIRGFERQIEKYQKTSEMLAQDISEIM
ncbi:MAG: hypothetical protein ACTSRG_18200, partial [Candidatus Helarchaeota archaeon]